MNSVFPKAYVDSFIYTPYRLVQLVNVLCVITLRGLQEKKIVIREAGADNSVA